jgi:hypothetical protein
MMTASSARRPINPNKIKGRLEVTHKLTHNGLRSGLALVEEIASAASPLALHPPLSRSAAP